MITLRLFHQSNPFQQIEERSLPVGELVVGRGEEADWSLPDPDRRLSRRHCVLGVVGGGPTLRDESANGVFIGIDRQRPKPNETVALAAGETLRLGDYLIVVDTQESRPHRVAGDTASSTQAGPQDAEPAPTRTRTLADASGLIEAFCAGAHLDSSVLASEEPEALMRRLGAVYREMVVGLTDLMSERTSVKAEHRMDRTTVRAAGNNPFRWAGEQRVAVDLLLPHDIGFLSGPDAVKASCADVKKHLLCVEAGARASLKAQLESLSPQTIESATTSAFRLNAASNAWKAYQQAHAACQRELDEETDGPAGRAFRAAYAERLGELDGANETNR